MEELTCVVTQITSEPTQMQVYQW